jgi:hypothetical protein
MAEIISLGLSSASESASIFSELNGVELLTTASDQALTYEMDANAYAPIWQNPAFQERPYHPITPSWRRPRTVVTNT